MVGYYGEGVPTTAELENNSNQTKYVVNDRPKGVVIPKLLCAILVMGALLLAALAAVAVYFLLPGCASTSPEALTVRELSRPIIVDARLPRIVEPTHYRLFITPFFESRNFTTAGNITMRVIVREKTDRIQFNSDDDLKIVPDSVRVHLLADNKYLRVYDQGFNKVTKIYSVSVDRSIPANSEVEMALRFNGKLNDNLQGFYRSQYVDILGNKKWVASTQFSPTDARKAFPCFDEPMYKAKFSISVRRQANYTSLSNMPRESTEESKSMPNWHWDHYLETPRMSTYLVAFAVSDLRPYQHNRTRVPFTVHTRTEAVTQTRYAAELGPKLLSYYEQYFNIAFPLPKIDVVAVPEFGFSAMENWGLITFRESTLLFDAKTSTVADEQQVVAVLAHELAHQWFGNLVTPRWWDDLWLKEGFAVYFEFFGVDHVQPEWRFLTEFQTNELHEAFELDSLKSSRPLSFPVYNSDQIRQAFDKISYNKGASIIRMVHHILGEKTFKEGLRKFLNKHKNANADHNDLWLSLTAQAEEDAALPTDLTVASIMKSWTKVAGFPVITATADYSLGRVNISQRRFLYSIEDSKGSDDLWYVPISNTTMAAPNFEDTRPYYWLKSQETGSFVLNTNGWWLLNVNQTGYYIVNYDETNWKRLVKDIMTLPPTTRAQLISDSMNLARANLLDYDIPLRMISTFGHQDRDITYVPLVAAFKNLNFLYVILSNTAAFGNFDRYIQSTFSYAFHSVRFNETQWDNYITKSIRQLVLKWACLSPDSQCVNEARHKFRDFMNSGINVSPNIRRIVYCTAIREGGEAEWNFAFEKYQQSNLISEKIILLDALGCTQKSWILSKYLNLITKNDTGIRKQDGLTVFKSVAKNIVGNTIAYEYLRNNWKEINEYFGDGFNKIGLMIESIAPLLTTEHHLEQIKQFKEDNKHNIGASEQAFDHAIETIKNNVDWMKKSYNSIEKWLEIKEIHYSY